MTQTPMTCSICKVSILMFLPNWFLAKKSCTITDKRNFSGLSTPVIAPLCRVARSKQNKKGQIWQTVVSKDLKNEKRPNLGKVFSSKILVNYLEQILKFCRILKVFSKWGLKCTIFFNI